MGDGVPQFRIAQRRENGWRHRILDYPQGAALVRLARDQAGALKPRHQTEGVAPTGAAESLGKLVVGWPDAINCQVANGRYGFVLSRGHLRHRLGSEGLDLDVDACDLGEDLDDVEGADQRVVAVGDAVQRVLDALGDVRAVRLRAGANGPG